MSSSTILVNLVPNASGTPSVNINQKVSKGTLIIPVKGKLQPLKNAKLYVLESDEEIKTTEGVDLEPGIYTILVDMKDHEDYYPVKLTYDTDPYPTALNQLLVNLHGVGLNPVGISEHSGNHLKNFFLCIKDYINKIPHPAPVEVDNKEVLERLATIQSLVRDLTEDKKKSPPLDSGYKASMQKTEEILESMKKQLEDYTKVQKVDEKSSRSEDIVEGVRKVLKAENIPETVDSLRRSISQDLQVLQKPDMSGAIDQLRKAFSEERKTIDYNPILSEIRALRSSETEKFQKEIEALKEKISLLTKEKDQVYKYLQEAEDHISNIEQIQ